MTQLVSQGELDVPSGQVVAVVLQRDQPRVQAAVQSVSQGGVLGTNPAPVP